VQGKGGGGGGSAPSLTVEKGTHTDDLALYLRYWQTNADAASAATWRFPRALQGFPHRTPCLTPAAIPWNIYAAYLGQGDWEPDGGWHAGARQIPHRCHVVVFFLLPLGRRSLDLALEVRQGHHGGHGCERKMEAWERRAKSSCTKTPEG